MADTENQRANALPRPDDFASLRIALPNKPVKASPRLLAEALGFLLPGRQRPKAPDQSLHQRHAENHDEAHGDDDEDIGNYAARRVGSLAILRPAALAATRRS